MNASGQRPWAARCALAGAALLGGCLSAPQGPTSVGALPPAGNLTVEAVAQRYIPSTRFVRISEYFDGQENKGGLVIERTDPANRTGYYFIVDLVWKPGAVIPKGSTARLEYIRADDPKPRTATFTFPKEAGTFPEFFLGLTGAEWPRPDLEIVAYKLTLAAPDGTVLAEHQSFLWSLPPGVEEAHKVAVNTPAPGADNTAATNPAAAAPAPTPAAAPAP